MFEVHLLNTLIQLFKLWSKSDIATFDAISSSPLLCASASASLSERWFLSGVSTPLCRAKIGWDKIEHLRWLTLFSSPSPPHPFQTLRTQIFQLAQHTKPGQFPVRYNATAHHAQLRLVDACSVTWPWNLGLMLSLLPLSKTSQLGLTLRRLSCRRRCWKLGRLSNVQVAPLSHGGGCFDTWLGGGRENLILTSSASKLDNLK